ncbi:unnamed protein product [Paramecium sonneborni]|uniref:TLDc domain-containing protein n=1 Tax=Paramecium sonneborni TaxID=65129 RepID=A0A8S1NYP9_9CILI|nr:unnamed protein product [Paramecium sonneborni]
MQVPCPKHEGSYLIFILLKENQIEFICDQCQTNIQDKNKFFDFQKLININKAIKQPEYLVSKIINSEKLRELFQELQQFDENNLNQQLKDIENIIENFQIQLSNVLKELQVYTKKYMELRQQIKQRLAQIIEFEKFKQYLTSLNEQEKKIQPQDISESEKNIQIYFENLSKKNYLNINNEIYNFLECKNQSINQTKLDYPQLKNLQQQYQQLQILHSQFNSKITPKFPGIIQNTQLITKEFQAKLIDTIVQNTKRSINKISLIYQGQKSDLNAESFWNQVDGKNNLLMVFQSQNEVVFGGYTPCYWIKSKKGEYINDETLTSFLFSQTNNKIYPIKQEGKSYAIYCNNQQGPVFGGQSLLRGSIFSYFSNTSDMMISSDFQNGSSTIGIAYKNDCSQSKTDSETLLFGQQTPRIIMYEIFQVTFI